MDFLMILLLVMAFTLGVIGIIYTTIMIYQSGALNGVISYFKNNKKDIEINTDTNIDTNKNTNINTNKIDFNLYKIRCDFCGCVEIMTEKEYEEYKIKINNGANKYRLFNKANTENINMCTSCFEKSIYAYEQYFKHMDKINEYKLSSSAKKIITDSISDSKQEDDEIVNNE